MDLKDKNLCTDIFKDIRSSEWNELQNCFILKNANPRKCDNDCSYSWPDSCKSRDGNYKLLHAANKLSCEISAASKRDEIEDYIKSGIFNFGIDLFYGSVQQNLQILLLLQKTALERSETEGFAMPLSVYLKLTPRRHCIGGLMTRKTGIHLKRNSRVILTTNRKHASNGSHKIIYVNAKSIINDVQVCDIICLGKDIELKVVDVGDDNVVCQIVVSGLITPRMAVTFPSKLEWIQSRVSIEELEDLAFALGTNTNVIISHGPGSKEIFRQLRDVLIKFDCGHFYLFTRLTLSSVLREEDAKWIAESYDGFLIDCSKDHYKDRMNKLPSNIKILMEKAYRKRKPIFLSGTSSKYVHPSDYHHIFYYPDKYILPCSTEFLHLYEAIFESLAPAICRKSDFKDNSLTGSTTLARSIAAASFEFDSDVIVMSAGIGLMAIKIAHFRPKAPIIAVTNMSNVLNYTSMHHNIWMLLFDNNSEGELSRKKETHQKLVYGVQCALYHKIVKNNSFVLLVYRKLLGYGYSDKFVVIKFDDNYVETIEKVILQK